MDDELSLREVTRENWRAALDLAVFPEQQRFIADYVPIAAIALAKAYIRPGGLLWLPYAFYTNEEMVGFAELAYEPESQDNYWLFHFFIDHHYQGRGYGKAALRLFLQFIRDHYPQCQSLQLTVHPENARARHLYIDAGFQPTGALFCGEPVYKLSLMKLNNQRWGIKVREISTHVILSEAKDLRHAVLRNSLSEILRFTQDDMGLPILFVKIHKGDSSLMTGFFLQGTSGHPQVDSVVQEVIQVYEKSFPGQIAACYVEGSYADQTFLPTSDIDLVIVFRSRFANADVRQAAEQVWTSHHAGMQEVDITVVDEDSLREGVSPNLKLGGRLIYGQDVCSLYPLLPIAAWARERMHAAYWLLVNVYHRQIPLQLPLSFPSPSDEFYGYANRTVRLADGQEVACTRNLVRTTGWATTALLALQVGQYVARKRDCVRLYHDHIGDEWTLLLEEIVTFCRDEWQYLIPTRLQARTHLRSICERTLHFEQHFLRHYKPYLLEQLRSTEQEHVRFTARLQQQLPLADPEVIAALQSLGS